jgi:hypothetical protein
MINQDWRCKMAEFCKACSIKLDGKDFGGLAGITSVKSELEGLAAIVICEGCGVIQVDKEGNCISLDCLCAGQLGHGLAYGWKGGGKANDRGKGQLFNRKPNLKKE